MVDLEDLDAGSIRLLPLLYRSLERGGAHHALLGKLKGVYRHAWYGNQLRLRDAAVVLGELRRRGIEPMLLKGAALTLLHYRDYGLRPMEDVDVLVRAEQWQPAIAALTDLGWRPRVPVTARRVAASHAMEFVGTADQRIDLRWIADAAMILRDASVVIDWDRLVELARRLRLVLPLRDALTYLEHALGIPVPHPVQAALRNTPVSLAERWEYRMRTRPASQVLGRLLEHRLRYRRLRRAPGHLGEITFVGYLQVALECDGIAALIRRAIFRHRWRERAEREVRARERALDRSAFP